MLGRVGCMPEPCICSKLERTESADPTVQTPARDPSDRVGATTKPEERGPPLSAAGQVRRWYGHSAGSWGQTSSGDRMSEGRILLVDDEPSIVKWVGAILRDEGYEVTEARDGEEGLRRVEDSPPDLIILDIVMPRIDGFEVCASIRRWSQLPIIMLSVRWDEQDKVKCLRLGADDYIVKPFGLDELVARVEAVLRRSRTSGLFADQPTFSRDDLQVDFSARRVTVAGHEVHLTPTEYDLLKQFVRYRGRVLSHQILLDLVWGPQYRDERQYVRVYVNRLRRALGDEPTRPKYIETVPGGGYRFLA